jgi:hypothetical protein
VALASPLCSRAAAQDESAASGAATTGGASVRFGEIRSEQAGEEAIRLLVPVRNRGGAPLSAAGTVRVLDDRGKVEAAAALGDGTIPPGATMELTALVAERIPPGTYDLEATVTAAGESLHAYGTMPLAAVSEVERRSAELADFPAPAAAAGERVEIEASFRVTGNVAYAPAATLLVRPLGAARRGGPASPQPLDVEEAAPGATGAISGSVELPADPGEYVLELRLLEDGRKLDSRSVSVTARARDPLLERLADWFARNAAWLAAALLALLVALGLLAIRRRRAPREAAGPPPQPSRRPPEPAPEPPSPQPAPAASAPAAPAPAPSLSTATFEDLRALGFSAAEAVRVLHHREELGGGFSSLDQLDDVPGISRELRARVKGKLRA